MGHPRCWLYTSLAQCAETLMSAWQQRVALLHKTHMHRSSLLSCISCSRRRLYGVTFVGVVKHGTVSIGVVVFGYRLVVCIHQTIRSHRVANRAQTLQSCVSRAVKALHADIHASLMRLTRFLARRMPGYPTAHSIDVCLAVYGCLLKMSKER